MEQALKLLDGQLLPINVECSERQLQLPRHHGDLFDRMLAAQALEHGLTMVSVDAVFDLYGVPRMWQ